MRIAVGGGDQHGAGAVPVSLLTIFLHEQQRYKRGGKKSLPDYELHICRHPGGLIRRFMSPPA
ncbi:MAG: hypothetical protein H7A47_09195 [Verrucomicrobiales bacterium]|nr:hypothetical protein [Verrucomicrobiales bacterium]